MPKFDSSIAPTDPWLREQWYNSLDCCVTAEIFEIIGRKNAGTLIYNFERAMQGPALDMMLTGFRIDPFWRSKSIEQLEKRERTLESKLDRMAHAIWGAPLNPRSPPQLKEFFYERLNLPEVWISIKGERKLSTNREALEKLSEYYVAVPFVNCVLASRDTRKKLGVLRSGVDPDGRMRCTYNVCGTETGRWASSQNAFGRGTNLQNITEELRRMFISDPGYIILYVDGEQAESRSTGFIQGDRFNDWRYLDACEAGDLHTTVAKLVWPNLGWTGERKADRAIADRAFYRHFSYRDMAKRGGHGTNYYGTPHTMARHLKVEKLLIEEFQRAYKAAFPAFPVWWSWCARTLMSEQSLTTFVGRERTFFGRPNNDATLREFIAYEPQSTVGDLINRGGYTVWKNFCFRPDKAVQILGQIHDAFIFQIKETHLHLISEILQAFEVPVTADNGRKMIIPAEAKVGWNWASYASQADVDAGKAKVVNLDGLRKWGGSELRSRSENPETGLLDRVFC